MYVASDAILQIMNTNRIEHPTVQLAWCFRGNCALYGGRFEMEATDESKSTVPDHQKYVWFCATPQ